MVAQYCGNRELKAREVCGLNIKKKSRAIKGGSEEWFQKDR